MNRPLPACLTLAIALAGILPNGTRAQLLNDSFEDTLGNPDLSHWQYTCVGTSVLPGPGAPGFGNFCALVPHSSPLSCFNSKLYQTVPTIQDGEVYTLSGWCCNWATGFVSPYIGFRMGTKNTLGELHTYTGPYMNTGVWTFLSVTDTFHVAVGDTAFALCDPGTVSGGSGFITYACFDGVTLTPVIATNVTTATGRTPPFLYDQASQSLVVHIGGYAPREVALFDATGRQMPLRVTRQGPSLTVDLRSQADGIYLLLITGQEGERVIRFAKS